MGLSSRRRLCHVHQRYLKLFHGVWQTRHPLPLAARVGGRTALDLS
jgi:hypothetical protein